MSAFWKDIYRQISSTMGRFFSLVIITALGAASVVGIQATSIDMRNVADKLYKEHYMYDLQLKSTTGFAVDDIEALQNTDGVSYVMPTTIFDVYTTVQDEVRAVRTYALPSTLNTIDVLEGRLPEKPTECAVERSLLQSGGYALGDSIVLGLDNMDEYDNTFAHDTFTIVGVVSSPLYISRHERGNTTLGGGSLDFYLYLHPDAYTMDIYTDAYVLMDSSNEIDNLSDDYYTVAEVWKQEIKQVGNERVQAQTNEMIDAQLKIDDGWAAHADGVQELTDKITEGRQKLAIAKVELDDTKITLENGQKALDEKVAVGQTEIDDKAKALEDGRTELEIQRAALETAQSQLEATRLLDASLKLDEKQAELDASRAALAVAQASLVEGEKQLSDAEATFTAERERAQAEIDDGWVQYNRGLSAYIEGSDVLDAEEADALAKLASAKRELEDAQEKLNGAPKPEWYYFTRKDGVAFDSYYQDTLRLQKIGYVFPMVFFLVAIMVSLTSMSRMVEEHRTQIGVYKALGYRPAAIMMKYFLYALSASLIGGMLGVFVGSKLFPFIISDAYNYLYNMPPVDMPIPTFIAMFAVAAGTLSVVFVTVSTCVSSMVGAPALLMRPKPPSVGKRVLLEKISFIWNRLSFTGKVTARNIFRYKRRFFMTLIGIAGCSALLLTAFGLNDSISGLTTLQYGSIIKYDTRAYLKEIVSEAQRTDLGAILPDAHLYIREESVEAKGNDGGLPASLIVPEFPQELLPFIDLHSPGANVLLPLASDSILLTDKLARVMGVSEGDSFTMMMGDGRVYSATVTGIVENYVTHFIYMSPSVYETLYDTAFHPNSVLAFTGDTRAFAEAMLENENVRAVIHTADLLSRLGDSTDAMGIVTIVLIVLACALALIVLFNLTNINISERIRELATIKVLGFYDVELSMYVYRENGAVTAMGILLGLVCGIFLHRFVLTSVEVDLLKFPPIINPLSYINAIVLSVAFAVFVNLVMNHKLSRIDMVESLKNVE